MRVYSHVALTCIFIVAQWLLYHQTECTQVSELVALLRAIDQHTTRFTGRGPFPTVRYVTNEIIEEMENIPDKNIVSFCHSSPERLRACSQSPYHDVRNAVIFYELQSVWLAELWSELAPMVALSAHDASLREVFPSDAMVVAAYDTWCDWVNVILRDALLVARGSLLPTINSFLNGFTNHRRCLRMPVLMQPIWDQFKTFHELYPDVREVLYEWADRCDHLITQFREHIDFFNEEMVESIANIDDVATKSIEVIRMLEGYYSIWSAPTHDNFPANVNILNRLQHWATSLEFPLAMALHIDDVDVLHYSHPTVGPLLNYLMQHKYVYDMEYLTRLCLVDDSTRTMCIRIGRYFDWDLLGRIAEEDAKNLLAPYQPVIQNARLFDDTRSIRLWDSQLRQVYQDFHGFFPDSEWPLILQAWCKAGETLDRTSDADKTFTTFHGRLRKFWESLCHALETHAKMWRAQIVQAAYIISVYEREVRKLRESEAINLKTCIERSLHYAAGEVFLHAKNIITPPNNDGTGFTKHHLLSSSMPEIMNGLVVKLSESQLNQALRRFMTNHPAFYAEIERDSRPLLHTHSSQSKSPTGGSFNRYNPRNWMKRSQTTNPNTLTVSRPEAPKKIKSENEVPRVRSSSDADRKQ